MKGMALVVTSLLSLSAWSVPGQTPTYDVLIRGGRILDGTGNPWFSADVAIANGRIAAIGRLDGATARRVVDARGLYVVPGFIDLHSHADEGLGSPRTQVNPNMLMQGVTTVVVNQDGRSPWPIAEQKALYERQGIGTNVVLLVGHGTVRSLVLGDDIRRPATPQEIERMKALVKQGLEEGAFGVSAGLEYVPGRWSTTEELVELAKVVAASGGFYIAHQRSEGRDPMWKNASEDAPSVDLLQAVRETIEISAKSGVVAVASHLKAKGASYWGSSYAAVRLIAEARERGLPVYADQYPYDTTGTDGQTVLIPLWALAEEGVEVGGQLGQLARGRTGVFARMKENLRRRLADPELREKIRRDIAHEIDRRGGPERIIVYEFPNPEFVGKSLAEIARRRGEDPVDTALWIQLNGLDRPGGARMRGFSLSELDIEHIMRQEFTATCSDAGTVAFGEGIPHPRYYGAFPRKIRRYVFERGVISLPFAIRSMTSLPAQIIGLRDRGLLREGYWADITIFDPETIADRATYADPHQYAAGILYVLVNGEFAVDGGKITGKLPGRVLTPARQWGSGQGR
jgi:N-acyl-D-amino-acid deacylase